MTPTDQRSIARDFGSCQEITLSNDTFKYSSKFTTASRKASRLKKYTADYPLSSTLSGPTNSFQTDFGNSPQFLYKSRRSDISSLFSSYLLIYVLGGNMLPSYLFSRISVSAHPDAQFNVCSVIHYGVTLLSTSLRWQRKQPIQLFLASLHWLLSTTSILDAHFRRCIILTDGSKFSDIDFHGSFKRRKPFRLLFRFTRSQYLLLLSRGPYNRLLPLYIRTSTNNTHSLYHRTTPSDNASNHPEGPARSSCV